MAPQSRGGQVPPGFLSRSTPSLPILPPAGAAQHEGDSITFSPGTESRSKESSQLNHAFLETTSAENQQGKYEDPLALDGSGSGGANDEEFKPPAPQPLHQSRSHSHLPRHTTNALFPPFYNRPPTPLPPSPSLTSLLRPSFSTATSGPTTPDTSDVDRPGRPHGFVHTTSKSTSSTTKLANSAQHAPTIPRAAPKVPTYEYYGFAVYLGSSAAFLMYIVWAYVPAPMLHQMGIRYYPNRWWALAIPCWLVVLVIYIYVALAGYNTRHLTLPLHSIENLVDECAQVAVVDRKTREIARDPVLATDLLHQKDKEKGTYASGTDVHGNNFSAYHFHAEDDVHWKDLWSTGTDAVMDVPIGGVCEILYGDWPMSCQSVPMSFSLAVIPFCAIYEDL